MRAADKAWLAMAAGVLAYELAAPDGELLSDGVDRYLDRHPWLTRAVIAATALHLINATPARIDPFGLIGALRDRL